MLKLAAQKKILLSNAERLQLADEIQRRYKKYSVSSISKIIWSLGTLKLPTRNKVIFIYLLMKNSFILNH